MSIQIAEMNKMPFAAFRDIFTRLDIPIVDSLIGRYQACFVGPGWLRKAAGPALAVSGLGGWWGKEFSTNGEAVNIVLRAGIFSTRFAMKLVQARSFLDDRQGLALHYQPGSPLPWPFIVDELRRVDDNLLLGMTLVNIRGLRGLAFPFVLRRIDA
jgi:hypothetical protein